MTKFDFSYQVRKSCRRKTLAITVHSDNRVVVSVPATYPQKSIAQFVEKKSDWIRKVIQANLQRTQQGTEAKLETGKKLLYLGMDYTLKIENGSPPGVTRENECICVRLPEEVPSPDTSLVKKYLLDWYMNCALAKIRERVTVYADLIGVKPTLVTLKSLKSRWGSCSTKGRISIAWNIIMAPEQIVDYLVVHELCHMVHPNHSTDYWDSVASILSDHRQRRKWLRENGNRLTL